MNLDINLERLQNRLEAVNALAMGSEGGINRVALTDKDRAGRDLLAWWMGEIGLRVRVDDIGTMYGRRDGTEDRPPVAFGSHLDSVPNGGRFDGALGVLAGLEVMEVLREHDIRTTYPLELINFTNEEGARFEPAMMASGVLAGEFSADYVYSRRDREGHTFGEELARIGYRGREESRLREASAFLELHVEQGPVLEAEGYAIGIVEGIQGITWMEVRFHGKPDHAGPTPMAMRQDALVAAARLIIGLQALVHGQGNNAVGTVGRVDLQPNVINVIPGAVTLSVDIRHRDEEALANLESAVRTLAEQAGASEQVDVEVEHIWTSPPTPFDPKLLETLQTVADHHRLSCKRLLSGAGHDAKYMASLAPTAMIFVRSIGGKSHSPEEQSEWEDIAQAARLLLYSVLRLAG